MMRVRLSVATSTTAVPSSWALPWVGRTTDVDIPGRVLHTPASSVDRPREEQEYAAAGRSHLLPDPGRGRGRAAGAARLRSRLRPGRPGQGRHGRDRLRPVLLKPRPRGRLERAAHRRQRAPPLRLERLLERALPRRPRGPRAAGTPLPDRSRAPVLADLCAG